MKSPPREPVHARTTSRVVAPLSRAAAVVVEAPVQVAALLGSLLVLLVLLILGSTGAP
ncbi:MAG TPA: hypothetical protein VMV46_18190 [Thermoanaerobaculia bacterium]|nr:hypothetical protein [Thermoanaerobaculia bacterium]